LIKKISDKDKEDWENFLKKNNNSYKGVDKKKILINKKIKKMPDKNQQDWENFLKNKEKIPNKDFVNKINIRHEKIKKKNLHG